MFYFELYIYINLIELKMLSKINKNQTAKINLTLFKKMLVKIIIKKKEEERRRYHITHLRLNLI